MFDFRCLITHERLGALCTWRGNKRKQIEHGVSNTDCETADRVAVMFPVGFLKGPEWSGWRQASHSWQWLTPPELQLGNEAGIWDSGTPIVRDSRQVVKQEWRWIQFSIPKCWTKLNTVLFLMLGVYSSRSSQLCQGLFPQELTSQQGCFAPVRPHVKPFYLSDICVKKWSNFLQLKRVRCIKMKSLCSCHEWENLFFVPACEGVQICCSNLGHFNMRFYRGWLAFGASLKWTFEELQFLVLTRWINFSPPTPGFCLLVAILTELSIEEVELLPHRRQFDLGKAEVQSRTQAKSPTSQGLSWTTPILRTHCQIHRIAADGDQTKPH